jgi:hypothetical protein
MMKYVAIILLCIAGVAAGTGCKKSSSNAVVVVPPQDTIPIYMKSSINGATWSSDSAVAYDIFPSGAGTQMGIVISATLKTGNTASRMMLQIGNYTGVGIYDITPPENTAAFYLNNIRHFATTGNIIITKDSSTYLMGSYNFNADTLQITSGSFIVRH